MNMMPIHRCTYTRYILGNVFFHNRCNSFVINLITNELHQLEMKAVKQLNFFTDFISNSGFWIRNPFIQCFESLWFLKLIWGCLVGVSFFINLLTRSCISLVVTGVHFSIQKAIQSWMTNYSSTASTSGRPGGKDGRTTSFSSVICLSDGILSHM